MLNKKNYSPKLAWNKPITKDVNEKELEKSLFNIFCSKDGEILWNYFNQLYIQNQISPEIETNQLHQFFGKKNLILTLKKIVTK